MEFLSPASIVNPYVIIEKYRKLDIVEKGLVCQSLRKQRAALSFRALKPFFFWIIPIFRLRKLCYLSLA